MNHRAPIAACLIAATAAVAYLVMRDDDQAASEPSPATRATPAHTSAPGRARVDPAKLSRGSLAGTVRDDAGAPLAGARVCADGSSQELDDELFRDPPCVDADAAGRFAIDGLL